MLALENTETNDEYKPTEMRIPFTEEEIKQAAKSLKNNKSTGIDELPAELIKYAPDITYKTIADIFNEMAKTGANPKEIVIGILNPLPKPKKKQGHPENLRPIILLSVIRKILTICIIQRTWEKFATKIPLEQAAYQSGRSTTEQVFTVKMLVEKAINASDYSIYILLLDMSKAFDTVDRKTLFKYLEEILEADELHLLSMLTRNPQIAIKVNGQLGEKFETLIGFMQGDVLSAILFIFYLACCLGKETKTYLNKLLIAPKYADDITYVSSKSNIIDEIQIQIPKKLRKFNLTINESKTEIYQVPKPTPLQPPKLTFEELLMHKDGKPRWSELDWLINCKPKPIKDDTPNYKQCKLLGSLLDTNSDIKKRKILAIESMKKLTKIFKSQRISIELKIRCFQTYVSSIFLYNSELWCMNTTTNNEVDSFHRKQLRFALDFHYPKIIRNEDLYVITKHNKEKEIK